MDIETIKDEILENGNRKINIGLRCYGELKLALIDESKNIGITLSEHCENILINHPLLITELQETKDEIEKLKKKVLELEQFSKSKSTQQKPENNALMIENNFLKNKVNEMNLEIELFSNTQLLYLFEKVKGIKDTINGSDGQTYSITYSQPKDLILAMIYSFNYKKQ